MSQSLEELRAQRALIQKHLNWLDAQIQCAEASAVPLSATAEQPTAEGSAKPVVAATPSQAPQAPVPPATEPNLEFDELAQSSSSGSDLRRAQIGCLAFFGILILLFLFFLFGLPYLID